MAVVSPVCARAMEIIYFTLISIVLYVFADWLLQRIELAYGRRLEQRSLIFFGILLFLALTGFALIRRLTDA